MSEKFTQGEWAYGHPKEDGTVNIHTVCHPRDDEYCGYLEGYLNEEIICTCNNKEDAKIIAAAPAMYYLLKLISTLGYEETYDDKLREWICEFLDRVIKKENA